MGSHRPAQPPPNPVRGEARDRQRVERPELVTDTRPPRWITWPACCAVGGVIWWGFVEALTAVLS